MTTGMAVTMAAAAATMTLIHATAPEAVGRIERLDPRLDDLIAPGAVIERVADGIVWAEGPLWDASRGRLLFSDIPRNAIFAWHPDEGVRLFRPRSGYSGEERFAGGEPGSNGLAFDARGRLTFCQHGDRRVVRIEPDGSLTVLADRYQGRRLNSPNDLVFRSNGDLYFTDPIFGLPGAFDDPGKELPFQGVFRLTPEGDLTAVITDIRLPNGIAFSPDERTLYVSNSQRSRPVWMAYPVREDGSVGPGREFAEASAWIHPSDGLPDGLEVDRAGHLFATGPGGVHVLAPDGARLGRIVTGVPTGNVAWGPDGTLYVAANHWILRLRTLTGPAR
ncbi:MAG: SMP-30/gluconolactonase/LRE family protein [Vicinamibacterales bacterium]